jgi:hypothetical protein
MSTAKTVHGKKVVVRKPKAGDMVVSRHNGKVYSVEAVNGSLVTATSTAWRGLTKPLPMAAVATLAVRQ